MIRAENITLAAGLGLHDTFELPLLTGGHFNQYSCAIGSLQKQPDTIVVWDIH
jgi:hypothetical protein